MSADAAQADPLGKIFSEEENRTFEDIKADIGNFADYERGFQEVLMALENDEILEDYLAEYAGLHHSFLKSHEGESRLLRKCADLQADIYSCVAKAQTAEELTEGDKQTIAQLRAEIDKTSRKTTQTRDKEAVLRDKILKLKREVAELEAAAKDPVEATSQEAALQNLLRVHEGVLKEKENQEYLVSALQHDMVFMERRIEKLRESKSANDAELRALREAIEAKQQEVDHVMGRKTEKEAHLRAVRQDMAQRSLAIAERQKQIQALQESHAQHREGIRQVTDETAALAEEYQILCRQIQHGNAALQECNEDNDTLQRKVRETTQQLQLQQSVVAETNKKYLKEKKVLDALQRRNAVAQQRRAEAEQDRDAAKAQLEQKTLELNAATAATAAEEKSLALVNRERDVLHQEHQTAEQQTQRNAVWLAEKATQLQHAEHELNALEEHTHAQNESLFHVTAECLAYENKAKEHALQCATVMSEVQARDRQIADSLQSCAAVEQRLKQQRALLEAVTSDRDTYTKHYGQLRNELGEMNKKFQLALLQIQQMKDEIVRREKDAAQEEAKLAELQRQRKEIEAVIISYQRRAEKKARLVDQFTDESNKLVEVAAEAREEVARQQQRCRDVLHERDLLHGQAVQRTKELTALCEKIHSQQALLQRSEALYRERVKHIEQAEYQSAQLAQQVAELQDFIARLPDLRVAVNNVSRELNRERVRVRALLDECAQPLNMHENNKLAWSEPETFELLQRVQKLQSQLTQRRQRLENTERDIAAMEKRYLAAKVAVARQPGPEVAEQLTAYQQQLVKKKNQLREMQASLQHFREQTDLYRARHDELRERLAAAADAYAASRHAADAEERRQRRLQQQQQQRGGTRGGSGGSGGSGGGGPDEEEDEEDLVYEGFVAPPLEPSGDAPQPLPQPQPLPAGAERRPTSSPANPPQVSENDAAAATADAATADSGRAEAAEAQDEGVQPQGGEASGGVPDLEGHEAKEGDGVYSSEVPRP